MWEDRSLVFESNKGADQSALPCRLISTSFISFLKSIISYAWSETPKTGFLMSTPLVILRHLSYNIYIFGLHNLASAWDFQQFGMCDQQRLSLIRAFANRLNILWVLSYWWTSFGVSKLKRSLHRLVWVYTCQNATLLEITCRGSFLFNTLIIFRQVFVTIIFENIHVWHNHDRLTVHKSYSYFKTSL